MEDEATTILSDLPLTEFSARLASRAPVPGGGSAAAVAAAMGAALVQMVVELTIGRPGAEPHEAELAELRTRAAKARTSLLDLAQADADAYDAVVRARKLPRETDAQRDERRRTMEVAMRQAAQMPLETARLAANVLDDAAIVAPIGNVNAASDAGVAALMASTGLRGAILNVEINLPYLPVDDTLRSQAPAELESLRARGDAQLQQVLQVVERRMQPS